MKSLTLLLIPLLFLSSCTIDGRGENVKSTINLSEQATEKNTPIIDNQTEDIFSLTRICNMSDANKQKSVRKSIIAGETDYYTEFYRTNHNIYYIRYWGMGADSHIYSLESYNCENNTGKSLINTGTFEKIKDIIIPKELPQLRNYRPDMTDTPDIINNELIVDYWPSCAEECGDGEDDSLNPIGVRHYKLIIDLKNPKITITRNNKIVQVLNI